MIYRYFSILLACMLLLTGLQIPAFVDQYEKRVDAHLIEISENLQGFLDIAEKYHGGSIDTLIEKHEGSADPTFQGEARPIRDLVERYRRFKAEKESLNSNLLHQVAHIVINSDDELVRETVDSYTYTITLNQDSAVAGAVLLIVGLLIADLFKFVLSEITRRVVKGRKAARATGN